MDFYWYGETSNNYCYPRIIDVLTLIYIKKGAGWYRTKDKTYEVKEGDMFVLKPYVIHSYGQYKDTPWTLVWFGSKECNNLIDYSKLKDSVIRDIDRWDGGNLFISVVKLLLCNTKKHKLLAISRVYEIFSNIEAQIQSEEELKYDSMNSVEAYIRFHLQDSLDSKRIAEHFGYSRSHFLVLFKKSTNMTLMTYIRNKRLAYAKKLLSESDMAIKDIAAAVGYSDSAYFSKVFKKYTGINPSNYCR